MAYKFSVSCRTYILNVSHRMAGLRYLKDRCLPSFGEKRIKSPTPPYHNGTYSCFAAPDRSSVWETVIPMFFAKLPRKIQNPVLVIPISNSPPKAFGDCQIHLLQTYQVGGGLSAPIFTCVIPPGVFAYRFDSRAIEVHFVRNDSVRFTHYILLTYGINLFRICLICIFPIGINPENTTTMYGFLLYSMNGHILQVHFPLCGQRDVYYYAKPR